MKNHLPLLLLGMLISSTLDVGAQTPSASKPQPHAEVTVKLDGKPLDERNGAPISTKTMNFTAMLDAESRKLYPDLQPEAVVQSAWVNLARGNKRVATQYIKSGEPLTKLAQQAQSGDRYVIEFDLAARRKNGKLMALTERPTLVIPLR